MFWVGVNVKLRYLILTIEISMNSGVRTTGTWYLVLKKLDASMN